MPRVGEEPRREERSLLPNGWRSGKEKQGPVAKVRATLGGESFYCWECSERCARLAR